MNDMGLTRPRLGQFQTTTAAFDDPIVVFNNNASGSNTKDIGIVFERGDDQNKVLLWDESADEFVLANSTEQGSTSGNVTLASYASLHINDLTLSGSIASLTINDAYTLPTADGTAGYVLKTDGAGTVSWASAGSDTSGHIIQSAGTTQTTRGNINFDGTYITVTDDSGNDQHDISVSSNLQTWHGTTAPSGTVVGTTDTQTLTNKTLTSPNITGLSLSGTTVTSTASELNILDGVTATTTELNYTDGVTSNIQTQLNGKLSTTGGTITSNLTVTGNLTVNGTTTTVSTTNMVVSDNLIELNNGASSNANDSGIVVERGSTGNNAFMGWDESADQFIVGTTTATGSSTGNLTVTASKLTVATPTASSDAATKGYVDTQVSGTVSSLSDLGVTATASELNKMDGVTATTTELNYVDGVTSNIQTQLNSKISGNQTITLSGDVSGSGTTSITTTVANDSHTHDTRYYTESEIQTFFNRGYISSHSRSNMAVGWYTIATNTGNRATGEFQIWDTASSRHQSVIFNATHHYGNDGSNDISVFSNSRYSTDVFRYIRIKENGTYDGAAIQVYIDNSTSNCNVAIVGANAQVSGWVIKDWIADATDPGDVSNWGSFSERTIVDLDYIRDGGIMTTGKIYAYDNISTGGVFSGTATSAQYADLAENYVSDKNYPVGTVLIFGGTKEVTISEGKENKRIAGVVSTDPAYLMNSDCEGEYVMPIALQGRVPCRVIGVVEKGDIIVSSDVDGVGIAWNGNRNPTTGSVIGKALENKNTNGEEVIEVVVGVR